MEGSKTKRLRWQQYYTIYISDGTTPVDDYNSSVETKTNKDRWINKKRMNQRYTNTPSPYTIIITLQHSESFFIVYKV